MITSVYGDEEPLLINRSYEEEMEETISRGYRPWNNSTTKATIVNPLEMKAIPCRLVITPTWAITEKNTIKTRQIRVPAG